MTRRKLLLWGVPAVLGLMVIAGFTALVLIPPNEASWEVKKIQVGMTIEQVRDAIGKETLLTLIGWASSPRRDSVLFLWRYGDGSQLALVFDNDDRLISMEVRSPYPSWYERIRAHLRKAGLKV